VAGRALLWLAATCARGVALEVDGLVCVLAQAGEPGPDPGQGFEEGLEPEPDGGRDAVVLEVRRVALLPRAGAGRPAGVARGRGAPPGA